MIQYILLTIETLFLLAYPLKRTYSIWKAAELEVIAYRETVIYWIIFAVLQAMSWNFDKEIFPMIRIVFMFIVIFKISPITSFLFRIGSKKQKTN